MLHFIIDGYNLINRIPRCKNLALYQQRKFLLSLLDCFKLTMSQRNKITVVFDGSSKVDLSHHSKGQVDVVFSKGQDADSLIKGMVDQARNVKSLVVVTDDKSIIYYARSKGTHLESTKSFLSAVSSKTKRVPEDNFFKLDSDKAQAINQELKEVWQKKFL
jgi:predicted RNA-binding protein with PIN domain